MVGFQDRIEEMRGFLEKNLAISSDKKKKVKGHQQKLPKGQQQAAAASPKKSNDAARVHRFRNVFAKPLKDFGDFVAPVHPKTKTELSDIKEALKGNFIYDHLPEDSQNALVNAMESVTYPKGYTIIKQGDMGDYMYVIEKGTVNFIVDGDNKVGKGEAGSWFGELALLYDCPRAATVICETDCQLWRVDQDTVRKIKAARAMENNKEARELVRKVPFLKDVDYDRKNLIADALEKKFFQQGDVLVQKGSPCNEFLIIKEGTIKGSDISIGETNYEDLVLKAGECVGQGLIESGQPWVGNAIAATDGIAYWLSRENFLKVMGGLHLEDVIQKSRDARMLSAVPILANTDLNPLEIDQMVELLVEKDYKAGTVFMDEGKAVKVPAIYLIRKGTIVVTKKHGGAKKTLKEGEVFGHDQLVKEAIIAKHTVAATTDVKLGILTLRSIEKVILDVSRLGKKTKKEGRIDSSVSLEALEKYKILGAGTFGQVWLVSNKGGGGAQKSASSSSSASGKIPYALKIQYKRDLIGYNQVEGVLNEKNIMEMIDHPFVIRLVNSYKDELRVYMLMQVLQGGELFGVLHTDDYDGVPEDEAVFYAAGILEGLSYMHRRNIIHRDLKGENVLMDADGYCVLIDLGFAKVVQDKTYTCCGTPIFMAPEVLLGEGHNHGADLWSLGVLIYDMIVGYTPFYVPGMTQTELYERIVRGKIYWPDDVEVSPEAKNLIRNLLFPDPSFRLGCLTRGDLDIRDHSWFKDIDFGKLFRKELKAPWVPNIKDPFDVSQFDDWSELENDKKERKPLSAKEQQLFDEF